MTSPILQRLGARIPLWLPIAGLSVIIAICLYVVADALFVPPPVGQHVAATPAPAVAGVDRVATPIKSATVRTYKPAAKARLKLPEAIQVAPDQQVIAASTIAPSLHAYTLTTLINTETGEVETLQRREPLPWLARDASGRVAITYAYGNEGPLVRLDAQQNLFRIKAWQAGGVASLTQHLGGQPHQDWLAGITLERRW